MNDKKPKPKPPKSKPKSKPKPRTKQPELVSQLAESQKRVTALEAENHELEESIAVMDSKALEKPFLEHIAELEQQLADAKKDLFEAWEMVDSLKRAKEDQYRDPTSKLVESENSEDAAHAFAAELGTTIGPLKKQVEYMALFVGCALGAVIAMTLRKKDA